MRTAQKECNEQSQQLFKTYSLKKKRLSACCKFFFRPKKLQVRILNLRPAG